MLTAMRGLFTRDIAIDLGTANTLVNLSGQGIVFNEPTVIAVKDERGTQKIIAVGHEAKARLGKTPDGIRAIQPLSDGVIADFDVAGDLIKFILAKALRRRGLANARVVITVPSGATAVERRAIRDATEGAGARRVFLIEEPIAAAIGAELPVTEPTASMVVDIGGGTTEVAVMSLGGIVSSQCIRIGGKSMDSAILSYMRRAHNMQIGESTAEKIKLLVGSACLPDSGDERRTPVKGRDLVSGVPREQEVNEAEIVGSLSEPLASIVEAVKATLEHTVPELAADMVERGMVLTGGGGMLRNLDVVLGHATGLPTTVAEEPLTCGARGAGRALEQIGKLEKMLVH